MICNPHPRFTVIDARDAYDAHGTPASRAAVEAFLARGADPMWLAAELPNVGEGLVREVIARAREATS